jgi:hypothetical protein
MSRHNLNYWRFGDYLGIGAGAHGKLTLPAEQHHAHCGASHIRDPISKRWMTAASSPSSAVEDDELLRILPQPLAPGRAGAAGRVRGPHGPGREPAGYTAGEAAREFGLLESTTPPSTEPSAANAISTISRPCSCPSRLDRPSESGHPSPGAPALQSQARPATDEATRDRTTMRSILAIATLLFGIGLMLTGNGLIGTLLGVRGQMEGFSSTTLGLIMGGYFTGFVAGTFIVPNIIRRIGHIRMFATLASLCSITVLLHGLFVHPWVWLLARAMAGVCVVGLYIVIESWLNEQTSNEQRGHIFSVYMTTTLIGLGVGQLLLLAGDIATLQLLRSARC